MTEILDFSFTEKKEKTFLNKKHDVEPSTYALSLFHLLDEYSDHFHNNYDLSSSVNENISIAFSEKIRELKDIVKLNLRHIASRRYAEVLHQGPSISEIMQNLKNLHKIDILPFEKWFEEIGIPINSSRIIQLSNFRNIWA